MTHLLFHLRKPPHGSTAGEEAVEAILAASVFEPTLTVLFEGDGVLQLLAGQQAEALGVRDVAANWTALPVYEVEDLRVHEPSLRQRGLSPADLILDVTFIDDAGMSALIAEADQILAF
ncbi:MAG: sulfurtransferase complex subunit TusC [Gammaproteobacteria bacterium]|nr:sulfurtransferase complex subunit TusC [Gammaproteobacteria bacterium]